MKLTPEEIRAVQKRENWQNECEYIDALFQAELAKLQSLTDKQVRKQIWFILDIDPIGAIDQILPLITAQKAQARQELIGEIDNRMTLEKCDPSTMAYFDDYYWIDKYDWQEIKE